MKERDTFALELQRVCAGTSVGCNRGGTAVLRDEKILGGEGIGKVNEANFTLEQAVKAQTGSRAIALLFL
jgi:hypothetical protein